METEKDAVYAEMNIVCLAGGVGGAKLAQGLAQIVPPERLTVIVNTGDDFRQFGLMICPDLDTVMYTLGGIANPDTGWGRADESWITVQETARLGGPDWFSLGDLDLATHLTRTHFLDQGRTLTAVTSHLCRQFGIEASILPMSNQPAATLIVTPDGPLSFQEWFVRERWQPVVEAVDLPQDVLASAQVTRALETADLIIFAPSNPFVSIDPILNVYPIREMIMDLPRAVVAVSPIVGGKAIKGPAAKMMAEWGMPVTAAAVAGHYGDLIDGFVLDTEDKDQAGSLNPAVLVADTIMRDSHARRRLAAEILNFVMQVAA